MMPDNIDQNLRRGADNLPLFPCLIDQRLSLRVQLLRLFDDRLRSEVISHSNWAKDGSTFRVSRPIEVVVLNCCVTATNYTPRTSNNSTILAKSASDRVNRSTL